VRYPSVTKGRYLESIFQLIGLNFPSLNTSNVINHADLKMRPLVQNGTEQVNEGDCADIQSGLKTSGIFIHHRKEYSAHPGGL
jgi:hypothetical protein